MEGSASVSLGMQAGLKAEGIGFKGNMYSEDMLNINGSVEYTKDEGDFKVDHDVYVKSHAEDHRSNHSMSVSLTTGVFGLEVFWGGIYESYRSWHV